MRSIKRGFRNFYRHPLRNLVVVLLPFKPGAGQPHLIGQILKTAIPGFFTGHAVQRVVGQHEFHNHAPGLQDTVAAGGYFHSC